MTHPIWITCQIGAREHYAIPRSLHQSQQLHSLCTDSWVSPHSLLHKLPLPFLRPLHDRYHADLSTATVCHITPQAVAFELQQKLQKNQKWDLILKRNQWFQEQTLRYLQGIQPQQLPSKPILFGYSYAARELFRYAKSQGWQTVLGQIDPGPTEDQIVQTIAQDYPHLALPIYSPPPEYWQQWREECNLADHIVVNSPWSAKLLQRAGISESKLAIIPLVYDPNPQAISYQRIYPKQFTDSRPLRVLFLGQIGLRKGIAEILEAVQLLNQQPIEWWMVGPVQIKVPAAFQEHPKIRWIGTVPRSQVSRYYQQADLFLLPTHSDGFAITQLESQAWHLPLITSQNCGPVVKHGFTGWSLSTVTAKDIVQAIEIGLQDPSVLDAWSKNSQIYLKELPILANLAQELNNLFV